MKYVRIISVLALLMSTLVRPAAGDEQSMPVEEQSTPVEPVAVGEQAPDFEVTKLGGKKLKLSDLAGSDKKDNSPVVLLFSRAHW